MNGARIPGENRDRQTDEGGPKMITHHGTESDFEYTTIQRLEALGYQHVFGMDIERPQEQVALHGCAAPVTPRSL